MRVRSQNAYVLPVTLMAMFLLELLAAGMLLFALQERAVARLRIAITDTRAGAESAVAMAVAAWTVRTYQTMRIGEVRSDSSAGIATTVERVRGDLYLVRAVARYESGDVARTAGRAAILVRTFDPFLVHRALTAAVVATGPTRVFGASLIDGAAFTGSPGTDCGPAIGAGIAAWPLHDLSVAATARVSGVPPVLPETVTLEPPGRIGGLNWDELLLLSPRRESGPVTLQPQAGSGNCDVSAAGNWGAPANPAHPCAPYFPLILSDGDLDILDGAGQGLLIVRGNLVMRESTSFRGIIVVLGQMFAGQDVTIEGAIHARDGAGVSLAGATVRFDPCAISNALFQNASLNRPLLTGRVWLPLH